MPAKDYEQPHPEPAYLKEFEHLTPEQRLAIRDRVEEHILDELPVLDLMDASPEKTPIDPEFLKDAIIVHIPLDNPQRHNPHNVD